MINPFREVNWNPGLAEKRKFALSLMIGFPCLAVLWLLIQGIARGNWTSTTALYLGVGGLLLGFFFWCFPKLSGPFYKVWFFLACCIGLIVSNTVLIVFYYTLFTAVGLFRRMLGRPTLQKSFDKNARTYWKEAEQVNDPLRYYHQY